MQKLIWAFLLSCAVILPLKAELTYEGGYNPELTLRQYFDRAYPEYDKPRIYVFYNDVNMSCENCPQTIALIERIYDENYQDLYDLFIIDYGNDDEYNFIQTYDLNKPLEVVLVRADDGATFGYKKIDNLNYQISDPISFADYFKSQINSFFGN